MTTRERNGQKSRLARGGKRGWYYQEDHEMEAIRGGRPLYTPHFWYNGVRMCARGNPDPSLAYSIDGASIPKWAQWIIRKDERTLRAAEPHDLSYQLGRAGVFDAIKNARRRIDKQFYHDLRNGGVGWWKSQIMYTAVRVGGANSYRGG